jgi:hypothetical protein
MKYYAVMAYGGVDVYEYIHVFLTSVLVGGEWSASRPCRFTPGERVRGTHCIGGWVDPRASLDDVEKILDPTRTRNSDPSIVQPVAIPTALSRLLSWVVEEIN